MGLLLRHLNRAKQDASGNHLPTRRHGTIAPPTESPCDWIPPLHDTCSHKIIAARLRKPIALRTRRHTQNLRACNSFNPAPTDFVRDLIRSLLQCLAHLLSHARRRAPEPAQDVGRGRFPKKFYRDPPERTNNTAPPTRGAPTAALARTRFERGPQLNGFPSKVAPKSEPASAMTAALWKQKCPASSRHFQPGCPLSIANQSVSHPERNRIRRPGS